MSEQLKVGARLRCPACGSEAIVVVAADAEMTCCGRLPEPVVPGRR